MARKGEDRTFNISVIGLSGTEREKGTQGVGKSCLCNRFVSYVADKYYKDHISVLSQSDFAGRVINNDHFLYWGEVVKLDDGINFTFHIIEQTEFIDDVSFQPFKVGRTDPYHKRCVATKVQSAEKLMYICKDQLGMETDIAFEQKLMPDGKLSIDGFICCFDVSINQQKLLDHQVEFVSHLLTCALKTKKPIVIATTKTEDAGERLTAVKELEKLLNRKEFSKFNIPIVGTSAHENVNVELAFMTLAHLIDKTKTRPKLISFADATSKRKELLDVATEAYSSLLKLYITDPKSTWAVSRKKLEKESDFVHFVEHFGSEMARRMFRKHTKFLQDEQIRKREQQYLYKLQDVLQHFLPDLSTIGDRSWNALQSYIRGHRDFDSYFIEVCELGESWKETTAFIDNYHEHRIPFDLLSSSDAETIFKNHFNTLQAIYKKQLHKKEFRKLLEENPQVTPGKPLEETYIFFIGKECYNELKPQERQQVYDEHQNGMKMDAKRDIQELLWEKIEIFISISQHISSTNTGVTQEEFRSIISSLQGDPRYARLDQLEEERHLILLNHLGFIDCPSRERCFFKDMCAETDLSRVLDKRIIRAQPPLLSYNDISKKPLNLVLLGKGGLAGDLCQEIRSLCKHDLFRCRNTIYNLDYRPIEDDVSLDHNSLVTAHFKPDGCLCVYSTRESFEYIQNSLNTVLFDEGEDDNILSGIPIVIVHAFDPNMSEKDHVIMTHKGKDYAAKLQCEFKDIPLDDELYTDPVTFTPEQIKSALISIVESGNQENSSRPCSEDFEPDIRIGMCFMCGDPFDPEIPLGPLVNSNPTQIEYNSESAMYHLTLETPLDTELECKQKVEICISSYHNFISKMFKDEEECEYLFHGFILVYSSKRKASFCTMKAFADNLRNQMQAIPILILAVTVGGCPTMFFKDDLTQLLITEGNNVADNLGGKFKIAADNFQRQTPTYIQFFQDAYDKRDEVSGSYYSVPGSPPPYGSPCMPIDKRPPAPLPRNYETFHTCTTKSSSNSQSTEESEPIYDHPHLPGMHTSDSELERPSSTSPLLRSGSPSLHSQYSEVQNGESCVKPSMLRQMGARGIADSIKETYRKSYPVVGRDAKLPSTFSLPPAETEVPDLQLTFRKSSSMKIATKEEEAWAINEPHHHHIHHHQQQQHEHRKATTLPTDVKPLAQDNGPFEDSRRSSDETVWTDNVLYSSNVPSKSKGLYGGMRYGPKGAIQAPLAMPEPIEIASEYATVKDTINISLPSESDYASVTDALPAGMSQRIRFSNRKGHSDSESEEYSSLERDAQLYALPNHKASRTKQKVVLTNYTYTDDTGSMGRPEDLHRGERNHSPSDGSEGTGDELKLIKKEKKKRSLKYKKGRPSGGSESSALSPQLSDSDFIVGSPPNASPYRITLENSALPKDSYRITMATSMDSADIDLNDSGNWSSKIMSGVSSLTLRKTAGRNKELKKKQDDERKRQKEEERKQKEKEKQQKKGKKKDSSVDSGQKLQEFTMSSNNPSLPQFVETCVEYIDKEGMNTEGIYRIPGNKQQVDLLLENLKKDPSIDISTLDIQVNAVATALKNFFNETEPLIPSSLHDELLEAAEKNPPEPNEETSSARLFALRHVLKKLHAVNYEVLKYFITHLNSVGNHKETHNMDHKNLALCLWPTIFRIDFNSYDNMAKGTKLPAEIIETLIKKCDFFFHGKDEV